MTAMRHFLATLCVLAALAAPAQDQDDEKEGGIVGTGIVGTVGPGGVLRVGGVAIAAAPDTPVAGPLSPRRVRDLRPGERLAVRAERRGNGWQARSLTQQVALIGPVATRGGDGFAVLGTEVVWSGTPVPAPGAWVAVSGLWQGRRLIASFVEPVAPGRVAEISGSFLGPDTDGQTRIGGTVVRGELSARFGDLVRVRGAVEGVAIRWDGTVSTLFDVQPGRLLVEGYLSAIRPDGAYTLLGSGLSTIADSTQMPIPGRPMLFCGADGRLGGPPRVTDGGIDCPE